MESIEPPAWVPPSAYLYTLKLDERALAWEYLRRNPHYRRDFYFATYQHTRDVLPMCWGLRHWEDPREDARSIEPTWLSVASSVIVLSQGRPGKNARSFDVWKIPGRKTLGHTGDHLNLTTRRGSEVMHRVTWPEPLTQTDPLGVSVAAGRGFTVRAKAAQAFLRFFDLNGEPFPERAERPSLHAITHMQVLQALDGEAAGASQREIARRLFGRSRDFSWEADSSWRSRVRYLVECGHVRCAHGYRRMVGLETDESPVFYRDALPEASPPAQHCGNPSWEPWHEARDDFNSRAVLGQ